MICPAKPSGEALVSNWQNWPIRQEVEDISQIDTRKHSAVFEWLRTHVNVSVHFIKKIFITIAHAEGTEERAADALTP